MARVKTVYWTRRILTSPILKAFLLFVLGAEVASLVSVSHVVANMPSISDVRAVTDFFVFAFKHTATSVQALSLLSTAVTLWLLSDLAKTLAKVQLVYTKEV
jgi:hypothetical protein